MRPQLSARLMYLPPEPVVRAVHEPTLVDVRDIVGAFALPVTGERTISVTHNRSLFLGSPIGHTRPLAGVSVQSERPAPTAYTLKST